MKILLTGAFGNLGTLVLEQLLAEGHYVTAFDVANPSNKKFSNPFINHTNITVAWGDIRHEAQIKQLVAGQDAVIHLAAMIAPFSENNPQLAYDINVNGTRYIIEAIQAASKPPVFIFSSSISVFGVKPDDAPLCKPDDPVSPSDHYSGHKIECEKLIKSLQSPWIIMRLAGMVDARLRHSEKEQARLSFLLSPDNKLEYLHPKDACTAIVNALHCPEANHKVLLIGGGKKGQVTHGELIKASLGAMGIQAHDRDFGTERIYAHWIDSSESQALLQYQHHGFNEYRQELFDKFSFLRPLLRPFSTLILKAMKWYLRV